jgi:20S proteasome alpha/beta subunit
MAGMPADGLAIAEHVRAEARRFRQLYGDEVRGCLRNVVTVCHMDDMYVIHREGTRNNGV